MTLLTLQQITKNFGGLTAVDHIDLSVEKGTIHGLIGPNGSGKTTVFNLITGIYPLTSGTITFNGMDITGYPAFKVNQKGLARTFQEIQLFYDMTVLENAMMGCQRLTRAGAVAALVKLPWVTREEAFIREKAMAALDFVGLSGTAEEAARKIPYGHQRLLEVARALAGDPELLLLDEPAAGMNHAETRELMALIARIREMGITVFLVEHNMKMVMEICEWITVINYGQVIGHGKPAQVQADENVINAYLSGENITC
ncbi:MAG: ABC transporter ATP-binding protein [Desulfotignum sp.]|nr:ABC transporter ATP-binding protein [Desulfotignum sp.]MCF8086992.1 ABC transporter ATP-binding protein [Desulfotignum sp.]MCF8137166.1 ABC transporter ATP-binding protein [Desulfotignum sp.]